jgi:predicted metalloprotease with PDZ domain
MRHLWRKHGRTGVGVTEEAFPDIVEQATGLDLRAKLGHWIEGTQELPIDQALKTLGWDVRRERKDPKAKLGLGVEFKPPHITGGATVIARIWEDMPSFQVLQPDDEMVAAEGYKWRLEQFRDQANTRKAGDAMEVVVFREGRLRTLKVPLAEMPPDKIVVRPRKGNAAATKRRKAWLGEGKTPPKKAAKGKAKRASKAKAGEATRLPPRGRHTRY